MFEDLRDLQGLHLIKPDQLQPQITLDKLKPELITILLPEEHKPHVQITLIKTTLITDRQEHIIEPTKIQGLILITTDDQQTPIEVTLLSDPIQPFKTQDQQELVEGIQDQLLPLK